MERKSHIHGLVKEVVVQDGVRYLYRCTSCGERLRRKSGVVMDGLRGGA
jgi:hypothetical protein